MIPESALPAYVPSKVCTKTTSKLCAVLTLLTEGPEPQNVRKMDVAQTMDLRSTFQKALRDMRPDEHQEMPGVDAPW